MNEEMKNNLYDLLVDVQVEKEKQIEKIRAEIRDIDEMKNAIERLKEEGYVSMDGIHSQDLG